MALYKSKPLIASRNERLFLALFIIIALLLSAVSTEKLTDTKIYATILFVFVILSFNIWNSKLKLIKVIYNENKLDE